jgi:PucR family transcriptional regulator, purine catabolism regulatory protein
MAATLRSLLGIPRFHLTMVVPPADPAVLDQALTWVHSSDLPDPTPWLEPGQLLLTDGGAFRDRAGLDEAIAYIGRLQAASVVGLGFATSVLHAEIPPALVAAAGDAGFPLIEVADRTPFMAIIRHVADGIAADQRERLEWLIAAQRAIARAALRVDGLTAILRELEQRLDCWVALFDAAGEHVPVPAERRIPDELVEPVGQAVQRSLRGRVRSAGRISIIGGEVTLQTLGQRGRLRGVLAIGNPAPLDEAGIDLVTSVIAIASVALEQSAALEESRRDLRAGLLELMLAGGVDVARRSLQRLGSELPAEPVRVVSAPLDGGRALVEELELDADRGRGHFFAVHDDRLVVVASDARLDEVRALLDHHGVTAGASAPAGLDELASALEEARRAAEAPSRGGRLQLFEGMVGDGMVGLLGRVGGREAARRLLDAARLRGDEGHELLRAATVWLSHNGAWDPAAKELGLHRHTLRARMSLLGDLLGLDLERFGGRAELWTALQLDGLARPTRGRGA